MSDFDLAVVGGGPGGYVAAERAAARGLSTVLVEREHLGGVCLNSGCIPTKTLIHSAKLLQQARGSAAYGVTVSEARYDLGAGDGLEERGHRAAARRRGQPDGAPRGDRGARHRCADRARPAWPWTAANWPPVT